MGTIVLAWWLISISNGPEGYDSFMVYAAMPLGILVLFGFTWAFAFHFFNGIRHLAWDFGYGFEKHLASNTGFYDLRPLLRCPPSTLRPGHGPGMRDICSRNLLKTRCTGFRA